MPELRVVLRGGTNENGAGLKTRAACRTNKA
jgi:hypothetical protein